MPRDLEALRGRIMKISFYTFIYFKSYYKNIECCHIWVHNLRHVFILQYWLGTRLAKYGGINKTIDYITIGLRKGLFKEISLYIHELQTIQIFFILWYIIRPLVSLRQLSKTRLSFFSWALRSFSSTYL